MTQAQKTAKEKFKQAIAYRQKTGVSLKEAFAHIYGKKKIAGSQDYYTRKKEGRVKPRKKAIPKKKVAKKVVKKKIAKKKLTRIDYDKRFQAKKPGKRKSASGKTYYENRPNRSDKGKLLGIGNINTLEKLSSSIRNMNQYKDIINNINKKLIEQKNFPSYILKDLKDTKKTFLSLLKEQKTHIAQLKKHIK
jgi:hypothetical protein